MNNYQPEGFTPNFDAQTPRIVRSPHLVGAAEAYVISGTEFADRRSRLVVPEELTGFAEAALIAVLDEHDEKIAAANALLVDLSTITGVPVTVGAD